MRARPSLARTDLLLKHIESAPEMRRLRDLSDDFSVADKDTVAAILGEAARFAKAELDPLNDIADAQGCRIEDGCVRMPHGFRDVYSEFVKGGWVGLDLPGENGGQGLPLMLAGAVQEIIDRSCLAFDMLPVGNRGAARLIEAWADDDLKAEWLGPITTGEWAATICISEAEAGSDVPRIKTTARRDQNNDWCISGEKMWISYGDHDLTDRIGHCVLARTQSARGLSLFLVPNHLDGEPNGVTARRLEDKMGLHASPTCALGFEDAQGWLLGEEGRGLAQMFVMIRSMRLSVGIQGVGLAAAASDIALQYAEERRQGGDADAPVAIAEHADVQLQLLDMIAQLETVRGLGLALAGHVDLARLEPDENVRTESEGLLNWLLPIFKTLGGECGFEVSSQALQVLGGAGYTREWPVEQYLRDARVLTIFEGATGIQALDLLHRRLWRDEGQGLKQFAAVFKRDIKRLSPAQAAVASESLALLEDAAVNLMNASKAPRDGEAGATAFLQLAGLAATAWSATRLLLIEGKDPAARRLRAAGRHWLFTLQPKARLVHAKAVAGADIIAGFDDIRACQTEI